jgi:cellulose synthase/poly-beta-1,6-N-acetylglucosamine synthase-like glycosyltransferase
MITDNEILNPQIPKNFWAKVQWMEYNRSYMLLRNSLKDKNCVTVIPGACSLISSAIIEKTGGYKHNHLGEDMEHTLNILMNKGSIQFISKVLSWTEVPDNFRDLGKQRVRWFRGALHSYSSYSNLLFNKSNKFLGYIFLPYIWIADILGCWIELLGWVFAIYTIVTSSYDYTNFLILWAIIVILHYLNFLIALLLIKKRLKLCKSYNSILAVSFIEGFTYHYLYVYWILKAHVLEIFGAKRNWNKLKRKGFNKI